MSGKYNYQLVITGAVNKSKQPLIQVLQDRVLDLGLSPDMLKIFDASDFEQDARTDAPTVAVYFGEPAVDFPDRAVINVLLARSAYILPLVSSLENFPNEVPDPLLTINGMGLDKSSVNAISSIILEAFGLLRQSRRLFISYKRSDSTALAIQLYEEMDSAGFDVFLDTHSVPPIREFQEELWHRLKDTDVVLLIDTPQFRKSKWTIAELSEAHAMSIGIFQMIWPGHHPPPDSALCTPYNLDDTDFDTSPPYDKQSRVTKEAIETIKSTIESLRAKNLSIRQELLIGNFIDTARRHNRECILQPQRYIHYVTAGNEQMVIVPTVGVPDAYGFHFSANLIKEIHEDSVQQIVILYDRINIKKTWQEHLFWLNDFLPVKSVSLTELEDWIKRN